MPDYIATDAINTYRGPSRLFIVGCQELKSCEGTTQGDPSSLTEIGPDYELGQRTKMLVDH